MTLDRIVRRNALRFPARAAVLAGTGSISWQELDRRADRIANALHERGLVAADRVAVLLGNCAEMVELYFGIARAGLIAVPLNWRLTNGEMSQLLERAEPALLVVGAAFAEPFGQTLASAASPARLWVVGGELPGAECYERVVEQAGDTPIESSANDDEPFAIFFTSGTTGLPKGAMVSHRNLVANAFNQFVADASRPDDVNLVATPLYHMGAVFMSVTYMMLGCTQVVLEKFDPAAWLDAVARYRASVSLLVPTMINAVVNHPAIAQADLESLRCLFYGGGPMPPKVLRRAMQSLRCGFTQGYGLTETLEATFLVASDHVLDGDERQQRRLASAGREAVGAEVRVVTSEGRDAAPFEVGEVLVRSESVIAGYWRMPEETARVIRDGWFHTGDLGYLDDERYLFVVDRIKDMVVTGGVNVYTKEVEAVLFEHPAVLEAAVVGLPDDEWGEVVAAAVVVRPGQALSAEALIEHCRKSLAGFKKPRLVHFLDDLPRNPSGKILKRELRRQLSGVGRPAPGASS
ncbi:MAG: long-chain-fatty-acid--CoA ligase [Burkholderiaceae bacterium]|nr:long-chain-fatty-acid--CoA ligase [Burkholderiaceae bacterium]